MRLLGQLAFCWLQSEEMPLTLPVLAQHLSPTALSQVRVKKGILGNKMLPQLFFLFFSEQSSCLDILALQSLELQDLTAFCLCIQREDTHF